MTRCTLILAVAQTVLIQTLALASMVEPSTTVPPPPDETRIRPFPLVNSIIFKARRGLSFECPDAFPVEPRGVMSVIKLPSGSEFDVHVFACEPNISPLDPNYIAESLEPAMTAHFPRLQRIGPGVPFEHPQGQAARFRYSGVYGDGDDKQVVMGVVYALVKGESTALLITECPTSGELPSMEIMQPIFRTFTFSASSGSTTPDHSTKPTTNPSSAGTLPHSADLSTGARIAYPDGFTPSTEHYVLKLSPIDPSGPTISVIDRLNGGADASTLLRAMVVELQDEFPTLHRTEDPTFTANSMVARLTGQADGHDRSAVVHGVVNKNRTLRIVLSGTPEEVKALEPTLDRMIAESVWPAPTAK